MIKLGMKVTDVVTGFTGIVTERTEYLTGQPRYGVQAKAVDNVIPAMKYFDEEALIATSVKDLLELKA